jgi:hypothetical protein
MNMAMGGDQEMIAALRMRGAAWAPSACIAPPASRCSRPGQGIPESGCTRSLAIGARTGLLVGEARDPQWPDSPGLVVIAEDGEIESTTPGVERWLRDLPDGDLDAGTLPSAVHAVAGRTLRTAEGHDEPGEVAPACSRARGSGSSFTECRLSPRARGARR